jgi:hypothetical protein
LASIPEVFLNFIFNAENFLGDSCIRTEDGQNEPFSVRFGAYEKIVGW